MKQRDDRLYLQHILDAISTIGTYLDGVDESTFEATNLLQDGVIRQIQIVGEAAKRVSPELCARYPEIPCVTSPACATSWSTTTSASISEWSGLPPR
jgi:uncharacterized protein with HEPN domain